MDAKISKVIFFKSMAIVVTPHVVLHPHDTTWDSMIAVWFCFLGFYGISTIVGYLMLNPLYTYILNRIWFGLVGFYGISTILGYLMPNSFYTFILNIYDLV